MKFIYRIFYHTYLNSFTSIFKNLVYYPDKIDKNFIFPLQYRPEASTSVLSPYYENDIEVIKNIAFSLPHGSWLYVKEHEGSVGNRKLSFYKEILTYPNVRLLDIYFPVKENWSLFKGVITLTSTMGFEALQNGVPVILLGNTFYQEYNDVIRISGWEQLPNELNKLARKQKGVSNKNILKKYLDYCFEGSFNIRSNEVLKSDNIDKLIIPIIRALKNSNT